MKPLYFFCGIGLLIHVSCAQSPKSKMTLDGKSYQISGWAVNQPDKQDPDLLSFKDGMMDSEGCHQYGFTAAAYQSTYDNGKYSFSCVTKSSTEGEIAFTGTVEGSAIMGSYVWKKAGQDDIHYAFKGSQKAE